MPCYRAARAGGGFARMDVRNTSRECCRTVLKDLSVLSFGTRIARIEVARQNNGLATGRGSGGEDFKLRHYPLNSPRRR
jgi:hypothetical protein